MRVFAAAVVTFAAAASDDCGGAALPLVRFCLGREPNERRSRGPRGCDSTPGCCSRCGGCGLRTCFGVPGLIIVKLTRFRSLSTPSTHTVTASPTDTRLCGVGT